MKTKEKILQAARNEFIKKGFANASMRSIAGEVGITATALYRHYVNKEEIFEAVIRPAVKAWEEFCDQESVRQTETAWESGLTAMWSDDRQTERVVNLIYKHFDEQKLLFCHSEGTQYAGFLHRIVSKVQDYTLSFMKQLEEKGIRVNTVNEKEMHLLLSAQYSTVLEMLEHDFPYEEARNYVNTVSSFFKAGWRQYLGF